MSPLALAIVLAPNLIRGSDPRVDAAMCLEPGKSLPSSLATSNGMLDGNTLVGVLKIWIEEYVSIQDPTAEQGGNASDSRRRCGCPWIEGKEHPTPSLPSSARMSAGSPISARAGGGARHELLGGGLKVQRRGSGSERSWTLVDSA